ncbi:DNA replication initiation control protein YabA [Streptococcus zalophi]|uniref:Replication initiation control protein YabA n=1 Tax=Streptococcus zalophi TaxID=640031 RepID=A0A934PA13_9STRE|nr:DNA replication initiation control protein YabA [Streptococcus zalophi]MBJ8349699.1 DNA replication initiation control protein YabA [Streptococcus zalophi]MCR8967952.1 DNA replication initiation control protein YabA [Streptococcus zalophi]
MDKKNLLEHFDEISQDLLLSIAEVEALKKTVREMAEENARLRLENHQLKEQLEHTKVITSETISKKSRNHLEKIYDEGFHVCNTFYGQHREGNADCVFCMELLYRE